MQVRPTDYVRTKDGKIGIVKYSEYWTFNLHAEYDEMPVGWEVTSAYTFANLKRLIRNLSKDILDYSNMNYTKNTIITSDGEVELTSAEIVKLDALIVITQGDSFTLDIADARKLMDVFSKNNISYELSMI